MKKFTLKFLQIAWPSETIAILLFTMWAVVFLPVDKINLWIQFLPVFGVLITAQGAAAGIGPLAADNIKSKTKEKTGE